MATQLPIHFLGLEYVQRFTEAYRKQTDPYLRESACEDVQFPAVLVPPRKEDLLAGKRIYPEVGYSVQYGGLGFYLDEGAMDAAMRARPHSSEEKKEWADLRSYWAAEQTCRKCWEAYPQEIREPLPDEYDGGVHLNRPAYPLYRMAGLMPDYEKIVRLGLCGLENEVRRHSAEKGDDPEALALYRSMLASIERVRRCIHHYSSLANKLADTDSTNSRKLAIALSHLADRAPESFHEGLQLILLVQTMTGTINFGRLDVVLGPLLCKDLEQGVMGWTEALELMRNFYAILEEEILHFDARIIVGGMGRANESEADRFAMLAMETTESLSLPMPQLTLRFHAGQNPNLLEKAYDVVGQGKTFPMIYNDSVNVPSVMEAFALEKTDAEQYLPFGCGEYMIDHKSCGTPNAIINLQRCLESALNRGRCLRTGRTIGPDFGGLEDYPDFESLWVAYTRTVEHFLKPLARAQEKIYQVTGRDCPYSLVSLLYDDCMARGRPIFKGGVKYLGGTCETYGNTNTADSLTAIRALLYEQPSCTPGELIEALAADWNGHSPLFNQAKAAPKYGNDDDIADAMHKRVHDHICQATVFAGGDTDLHHFLVVVINNNHNTLWGKTTSASADGRKHGEPLAPGNAPGAGNDQSGLTAVLNSQAKPDPAIHAGTVQNVRISASLPQEHNAIYRAVFDTYFSRGGTQAMITVTNRDDLLAALKAPEKYNHLLVRVGGFSARFVDLDPATQREILSRTEHSG